MERDAIDTCAQGIHQDVCLEQRIRQVEEQCQQRAAQLSTKVDAIERCLTKLVQHLNLDSDFGVTFDKPSEASCMPRDGITIPVAPSPRALGSENDVRGSVQDGEKSPFAHDALDLGAIEDVDAAKPDQDAIPQEMVPLEETVWDAAVLVGLRCSDQRKWFVGRANRIMITILLLVNIAMQGIFLMAIPETMSGKPYDPDTIEALRYQRLFRGQDYAEVNRINVKTRTANLCSQNLHNRLAGTWEDIYWYLGWSDSGSLSPGGTLICMLAMLIWILSMATEIRRAFDVAFAVFLLPRTMPNSPSIVDDGESGNCVVGMGIQQKMLLLFSVFIPRFAIAFALLYFGLKFLADTPAVGDLILNACALEIVKNVDELLFTAILSRRFHQGVQSIQIRVPHIHNRLSLIFHPETTAPINGPHLERKRNLVHVLMYVRVVFIALVMFLSWEVHLKPVYESTKEAREMICGFEQDFTYVKQPSSGMPAFALLDPDDNTTGPLQCYYAAEYELLRIRAGMKPMYAEKNATLEMLVNGTHELCRPPSKSDPSPLSCPEYDRVSKLADHASLSQQAYLQGKDCRDQDVHLTVLRQTCVNGGYITSSPAVLHVFESQRQRCSDFVDLCGLSSNNYNKALKKGITPEWIRMIQGVCPHTCGQCKVPAPAPTPAPTPGGSRSDNANITNGRSK
jgi:hypothetical protein